jgi:hypothetical protein
MALVAGSYEEVKYLTIPGLVTVSKYGTPNLVTRKSATGRWIRPSTQERTVPKFSDAMGAVYCPAGGLEIGSSNGGGGVPSGWGRGFPR